MKTKIQTLKEQINNLTDPRRTSHGNIRHKLEDIIITGLCTIICGGEDYADMEASGTEREEFLRRFLELPNGIPDSDINYTPFYVYTFHLYLLYRLAIYFNQKDIRNPLRYLLITLLPLQG